jgi:hypothetical protein
MGAHILPGWPVEDYGALRALGLPFLFAAVLLLVGLVSIVGHLPLHSNLLYDNFLW